MPQYPNLQQLLNMCEGSIYNIELTNNPNMFRYRNREGHLFIIKAIDSNNIKIAPVLDYNKYNRTVIDFGSDSYKPDTYIFGVDPAQADKAVPVMYVLGHGTLRLGDNIVLENCEGTFTPNSEIKLEDYPQFKNTIRGEASISFSFDDTCYYNEIVSESTSHPGSFPRIEGGILRDGFISCDPEGTPEAVVPLPEGVEIPVNFDNARSGRTNSSAPNRSNIPQENTGGIATGRFLVLSNGARIRIDENGFANPERVGGNVVNENTPFYSGGIVSEDTQNLPIITNEFVVPLPNGEEIPMVTMDIEYGTTTHREDWEVRIDTDATTFQTATEANISQERYQEIFNRAARAMADRIDEDILSTFWSETSRATQMAREAIEDTNKKLKVLKWLGELEAAKHKPRLLMITGE